MDFQGQPIPPGHRSTKMTNDPLAEREPIYEPSGAIHNDSLAAESVNRGGAFSENRRFQPTSKSYDADFSGEAGTQLPAAPASAAREDQETQKRYPDALGGQGVYPGTHVPESGYVGGPKGAKSEMEMKLQQQQQQQRQKNQDDPLSFSSTQASGSRHSNDSRNDMKNYSFDSTIGSKNDPGRVAESSFQHRNAKSALDSGVDHTQKGVGVAHGYQPLERDQRA